MASIPRWLEYASVLAEVAGGFATALAAGYGFHEFRQWKKRKQSEDRAAAAARALAALEPFCNAVNHWMNCIGTGVHAAKRSSSMEAIQELDRWSRRGWEDVERRQQDLAAAGFAAQAYLTDEELAPLSMANGVSLRAHLDFDNAMNRLGSQATGKTDERQNGVCEQLDQTLRAHEAPLEQARTMGREIFRRIAQHDAPPRRAARG